MAPHYYSLCQFTGNNCTEEQSVRLVGGSSDLEGRVEFCNSGVWSTLCHNIYWNLPDATVVCRQLGFNVIGRQWLGYMYASCIAYRSCLSMNRMCM